LAYRGARPARLATAQPTWAFQPEAESRGALSPIDTSGLPAKSGRAATGGLGAAAKEQAPTMGTGVVSGVRRGTGVVVHGGTMTAGMAAQWRRRGRRRKKGRYTRGGGCSFYSRRRQLAKAVRDVARAVAAVKLGAAEQWRPQSKRSRHGQRRCSDRAADGWPQRFRIFPIYPKLARL
jgi:hypothetical protein